MEAELSRMRAEQFGMREEIATLRLEMRERFENVVDRLKRVRC